MSIQELNKFFTLAKNLFPINRSITGNGTKKTLRLIKNKAARLWY